MSYLWNAPLTAPLYFMGGRERTKGPISPERWKKLTPNPRFLASQGVIRPEYKAALERIFKRLSQLEGIRSFAVETPMAPVAGNHPYVQSLQRELAELITRTSPLTVQVDSNQWSEFDRTNFTLFHDDHHLSQQGRTLFSQLFLEKVMGFKK